MQSDTTTTGRKHRYEPVSGFAPVDDADRDLCGDCGLPQGDALHDSAGSTRCPLRIKSPFERDDALMQRCALEAGHDSPCAMALR